MLPIVNTIGLLALLCWMLWQRRAPQPSGRSRALVQVRSGQIAAAAITESHLSADVQARLNGEPSSITSISAGSAIAVTKPVMRVVGNGGPVTMTATPNVADGTYDGQIVRLQGTDDTNWVQVRDAANLPGSGLHLQHGQDFALGKNDILELMWNDAQSLWIELRRIDNY